MEFSFHLYHWRKSMPARSNRREPCGPWWHLGGTLPQGLDVLAFEGAHVVLLVALDLVADG